ncbi:hypothetical protein BGAFAR04_Ab0048 (plasmid) [Borreliella garinii Far04]|nr:hypothetical protein BGAFAR04_Ab0048 [Borreliella garinii Far04]
MCYKVFKSILTNCSSRVSLSDPLLSHFCLILYAFTLETPSLAAISLSLNDPSLKYATQSSKERLTLFKGISPK